MRTIHWRGVTLKFDVDVVSVREATQDELAHGHVHGPGDINTDNKAPRDSTELVEVMRGAM